MNEIEKCKECGNKEIYQDNLCFKCFGKQLFSGLGEKSKEQQLQEEIERLQEDVGNYVNIVLHDRKEIDRLNSIIKEVREYIEDNFYQSGGCVGGTDLPYSYIEELLDLLDKENK